MGCNKLIWLDVASILHQSNSIALPLFFFPLFSLSLSPFSPFFIFSLFFYFFFHLPRENTSFSSFFNPQSFPSFFLRPHISISLLHSFFSLSLFHFLSLSFCVDCLIKSRNRITKRITFKEESKIEKVLFYSFVHSDSTKNNRKKFEKEHFQVNHGLTPCLPRIFSKLPQNFPEYSQNVPKTPRE